MVLTDEIKSRISIEDILAEQGIFLKGGRCRCPLHNGNNSTSFSVRDGFFHCFACGESGDVITLVQKLYGLDFKGAVEYLARKAGFDYDIDKPIHPKKKNHKQSKEQNSKTEVEHDLVDISIRLWTEVLKRLEKNLREGRIDLPEYYAEQQYAEYRLSQLDELSIEKNYERNQRRKRDEEERFRSNSTR